MDGQYRKKTLLWSWQIQDDSKSWHGVQLGLTTITNFKWIYLFRWFRFYIFNRILVTIWWPQSAHSSGGGLVTVYRYLFKCNLIACNDFVLLWSARVFCCNLLPPFFIGRLEFLSSLVLQCNRIVPCGDFNIHDDESSNIPATDFLKLN